MSHISTLAQKMVQPPYQPPLMGAHLIPVPNDPDLPVFYLLLFDVSGGDGSDSTHYNRGFIMGHNNSSNNPNPQASSPLHSLPSLPPMTSRSSGSNAARERKAQENLSLLRRAFGEDCCALLRINSQDPSSNGGGSGGQNNHASLPSTASEYAISVDTHFRQYFNLPVANRGGGSRHFIGGGVGDPSFRPPPPLESGGLVGTGLSSQDLTRLSDFTKFLACRFLLPRLE
eukprot:CAMPEP_0175046096 /NCGR_PEP_ID=MMETSP0052_2-20121109/4831_1 /TAXON_ID=51329 ORGANISM="Polytomella parva, Strain SAG 63-3" /NCGR_SAMPLE_ID=MMETSP0052_2 /ASSEMBLY_ACC=CAM_ASM_000194 /LENGTH=228 /DNA_ID=CAMNT_0016309785 /DNA_START=1056 /DNA_END=1739 /DNA_ORIENTATION=-